MKKFLIGIVVIALIGGAYFFGRQQAQTSATEKQGNEILVQSPGERPAPALDLPKPASKKSSWGKSPLPLANIPLVEIHDVLQQRADAGDGKAACRLAIELLRCLHARNISKYLLDDSADNDFFLKRMARRKIS